MGLFLTFQTHGPFLVAGGRGGGGDECVAFALVVAVADWASISRVEKAVRLWY